MTTVRYGIVRGLETLCMAVDHIPWYDHGWLRHGQLGCRIGLARWSAILDDHWGGTGAWEDVTGPGSS